jgi:predicted kinase
MPTIFMLRGLPASGKSTERRKLLADATLNPITYVNKDEIRRELNIKAGIFDREKEVKKIETARIMLALETSSNLIVDNTHNSPKYCEHYTQLAAQHNYDFQVIDLSHVPVEECIRRDALRTGHEHVGEVVIRRMWSEFYQ